MNEFPVAEGTIQYMSGIAKTEELNRAGLSNKEIKLLSDEGLIHKLQQGYYYTARPSEEKIICRILPEAIICMESALFFYGYSDWTPRTWMLAVPRTISRSRLKSDAVSFKAYFVQPSYFELGLTSTAVNGTEMRIYDRERCICDCFRYRTKMDAELFGKAVSSYTNDPEKNVSRLYEYAGIMEISKNLNNLMEVMLNGK